MNSEKFLKVSEYNKCSEHLENINSNFLSTVLVCNLQVEVTVTVCDEFDK